LAQQYQITTLTKYFQTESTGMDIDLRPLIVLLPIAAAAGWAGFNIFRAALGQLDRFLASKK
jgi:photosystem II PsbY protein